MRGIPVNPHDINFGQQVDLGIQGSIILGTIPLSAECLTSASVAPSRLREWALGRTRIRDAQNTYELIDNLSWYRGRHSFKMGVDIRRYQDNDENKPPELRGSYSFDDQLSGLAYANFLLGFPTQARRTTPRPMPMCAVGIMPSISRTTSRSTNE